MTDQTNRNAPPARPQQIKKLTGPVGRWHRANWRKRIAAIQRWLVAVTTDHAGRYRVEHAERGRPGAQGLYLGGVLAGHEIAEIVKLPYTGVLETIIDFLKREKYIEVRGAGGFGESSYQYIISAKGAEKARKPQNVRNMRVLLLSHLNNILRR